MGMFLNLSLQAKSKIIISFYQIISSLQVVYGVQLLDSKLKSWSTAIVGNDPSSSRTEVKEVHKEEKNEGDFPCIGTRVKIPMLMTRVRRRNICLLRILRSLCWKRRRRKPLISNCNLIIVAILIDKLNNFFFVIVTQPFSPPPSSSVSHFGADC